MNLDELEAAAKDYLRLVNQYPKIWNRATERFLDISFYAFLQGRFEKMSRQLNLRVSSSNHPLRIDFRHGGNNPVLIELAVRPKGGGQQFDALSNRPELRKLARFRCSQARVCVLLLLDLNPAHLNKNRLKHSYNSITSSGGKYRRHPVTVIYVHPDHHFRFEWSR